VSQALGGKRGSKHAHEEGGSDEEDPQAGPQEGAPAPHLGERVPRLLPVVALGEIAWVLVASACFVFYVTTIGALSGTQ